MARDGVSDVLVKVTTEDGLVGWGEACCGADTASVDAAVEAMAPFVVGRDPWNRDAMRRDAFTHGLWQFRAGTGNFAWAGIDMALWDLCGRACGQPLWRLLGGLLEPEATYFYYLRAASARASPRRSPTGSRGVRRLLPQGRAGRRGGPPDGRAGTRGARHRASAAAGRERRLVAPAGAAQPRSDGRARHGLRRAARARPPEAMPRCGAARRWPSAPTRPSGPKPRRPRIRMRQADVYCLSGYWVGGIAAFQRMAWAATPRVSRSASTRTASSAWRPRRPPRLPDDPERRGWPPADRLPDGARHPRASRCRSRGPRWGTIEGPGLGVEVDEDAVAEAAARYRREGSTRRGSRSRSRGRSADGRPARGKVALVVGGGSGMGRAGSAAMAAEGAVVVVADIALERAARVAAASQTGGRAVRGSVDVT